MRSHNRARLSNETTARLHIIYITYLLALITSNDIDRTGSTFPWLVTATIIIVFVLIASFIVSGRTMSNIQNFEEKKGGKHQCNPAVGGVCDTPVGWRLYCKVCFLNTILALVVGLFCLWLAVSPSFIKHDQLSPAQSNQLQHHQKASYDVLQAIFQQTAQQTKDQFEETVLGIKDKKIKDDKLNASYWFSYNGNIYLLSSTEEQPSRKMFAADKSSIIGCGFTHSNHSVRWDDTSNRTEIMAFNGDPSFEDQQCGYAKEPQRKIKSIVCTSYNTAGFPETTVGICIFTENSKRIFVNNYHDFLRGKAEEFYTFLLPILKQKTLIPEEANLPPQ
jgi:hypothetical protein